VVASFEICRFAICDLPICRFAICHLPFADLPFEICYLRLRILLLAALGLSLLALVGCQDQPQQLFIEVDRSRRSITTESATVRDALTAAGVSLGALDRVSPDLYVETEPGMVIVVTRVEEEFESERVSVPFERKTVINEALPAGETRLIQLGVNGEDEITYRITLENDIEVERTQVSRLPISEPVDEIIAVGAQDRLEPAPIDGVVAYLSAGNAWVMRADHRRGPGQPGF
jgi:hypothetical protein